MSFLIPLNWVAMLDAQASLRWVAPARWAQARASSVKSSGEGRFEGKYNI